MFAFQTRNPGVGNFHEHLADDLLRGIANGQLKPGEKIPTQTALADSYNYSVSVVRQATKSLKVLKLVAVVKRSQGTVVLPGATQKAQAHLRARGRPEEALRRDPDIELSQPSGDYSRDATPRAVVALGSGMAVSLRRPTGPELAAGRYAVDELVADVADPDGTIESHGTFHTTFKLPSLPPVEE